jgi:hypothetical protein
MGNTGYGNFSFRSSRRCVLVFFNYVPLLVSLLSLQSVIHHPSLSVRSSPLVLYCPIVLSLCAREALALYSCVGIPDGISRLQCLFCPVLRLTLCVEVPMHGTGSMYTTLRSHDMALYRRDSTTSKTSSVFFLCPLGHHKPFVCFVPLHNRIVSCC